MRTTISRKMLINNKFEAQTLTGNSTGNSRCHAFASRALNMSCSFGQSARSIESRCVVKASTLYRRPSYRAVSADGTVILHYIDVIMTAMASQITSLTVVYSTVYSRADQRKHQSPASLAFVWGIHRGPVNSPHKGPVTRKMFPFDDVIMKAKTRGMVWV